MTWEVEAGTPGIDVSHHQGKIDWHRVKACGVGWAAIKVTEGHSFRDPLAHEYIPEATAAGIAATAAYHFARPTPTNDALTDAAIQVHHYATSHPGLGPALLDWEATEPGHGHLDDVDPSWQVAWIGAFFAGLPPEVPRIVYADYGIARLLAKQANAEGLALPKLWLARWLTGNHDTPTRSCHKVAESSKLLADRSVYPDGGWEELVWWQWSNQGYVSGIGTGVDLDVAVADLAVPDP